MKTIYKYMLEIIDFQEIEMKVEQVLCCQMQKGNLCIWVLIDTEKIMKPITFMIHGTGNFCPEETGTYLGTVQQNSFVWHVFYKY